MVLAQMFFFYYLFFLSKSGDASKNVLLSLCFPKKSIFGIKNIAWILTIQRRLSDEAETDLNRASTLKDFKNATEFIILLLNCAGSKKIA